MTSPRTEVRFPALTFSRGVVGVVESGTMLCTKLAFTKGYFKQLVMIDREGIKFAVTGARKLGIVASNGRQMFGLLTGNPYWRVELIFDPATSKASLEEIKDLIFDSFSKEKYTWEEMTDFEEFRDKISTASSIGQLFATFEEFHQG